MQVRAPVFPFLAPSWHAARSPSSRASTSTSLRYLHTSLARSARQATFYEALSLPKNATKQQIKSQFYALSKRHHPDAGGNTARFHEISEAYGTLGDDSRRREYDLSFRRPSTSSPYGSAPTADPFNRSSTGGQYWSPRRPSPRVHPTPGYTYNPFGRHTPHGYQPSSSSYGASPNSSSSASPSGFNTGANFDPLAAFRQGAAYDESGNGTRGRADVGGSGGGGILGRVILVGGLLLVVLTFGGGVTTSTADTGERRKAGDWEGALKHGVEGRMRG